MIEIKTFVYLFLVLVGFGKASIQTSASDILGFPT